MDVQTWFLYAIVVGILLVAFVAIFLKMANQKSMIGAFALGFLLVFAYAFYIGDIQYSSGPEASITGGVSYAQFDVELSVNGTANGLDNTTEDDYSFTTPYRRNTTGNTMTTTGSTAAAPIGFVDPILNMTIRPIPTTGVSNDDLVTIKFSANDPGECITSSGTDYRLISQDANSKPYLYWKCVKDDGTYIGGTQIQSGSATFLYTDTVYLWLNVVYQDSGCSRLTDFTTKGFTITLTNIDGSWSQTIPVTVMPIGSHT